jgi:hypothetical protein
MKDPKKMGESGRCRETKTHMSRPPLCTLCDPFQMQILEAYLITSAVSMLPWTALWIKKELTIMRMVILLFALDTVLTIEAAIYSDIVSIAILHIFMVPALFGLVYLDLVQQHKAQFHCFLCGKIISSDKEYESAKRVVRGKETEIAIHTECLTNSKDAKKPISVRRFQKGIPP